MENTLQLKDRSYSFGTIPAIEAVEVMTTVSRIVGEPLFKAFTESRTGGTDATEQAGAAAIGLLLSRLNSKELIETFHIVFKYVSVDGKRLEWTSHFTGKMKELIQVFVFALRFNFGDFLPESLLRSIQPLVQK